MRVFNDKAYQDFKDKLNSGESIVEYLGKMGHDTTAHNGTFYRCPFHNDKTPSLSINDKKGVFKCFSCGRGGHYFDFVYQYHKTLLGYKNSPKEFANILISKSKTLQKKYGIESLEKPVVFSTDTVEYMLDVKHLGNENKRKLRKALKSDEDVEISPQLELEKRIRKISDIDEIMKVFSEIQKGNIQIGG